jgi:hypothetical protein
MNQEKMREWDVSHPLPSLSIDEDIIWIEIRSLHRLGPTVLLWMQHGHL